MNKLQSKDTRQHYRTPTTVVFQGEGFGPTLFKKPLVSLERKHYYLCISRLMFCVQITLYLLYIVNNDFQFQRVLYKIYEADTVIRVQQIMAQCFYYLLNI